MTKLSARERALIQHAKRRALENFQRHNRLRIYWKGKAIADLSLEELRCMNNVDCIPPFTVRLDWPA